MSSLTVNGSVTSVETGTSFKDTVIGAARDAGFGKFRVFLNGSEIDPAAAPEYFDASMNLEIKPYEVAG